MIKNYSKIGVNILKNDKSLFFTYDDATVAFDEAKDFLNLLKEDVPVTIQVKNSDNVKTICSEVSSKTALECLRKDLIRSYTRNHKFVVTEEQFGCIMDALVCFSNFNNQRHESSNEQFIWDLVEVLKSQKS